MNKIYLKADKEIIGIGKYIIVNGLKVVATTLFISDNPNVGFMFDDSVNYYKCTRPSLWPKTIEKNGGNTIFKKDFIVTTDKKTILQMFFENQSNFVPSSLEEYSTEQLMLEAIARYPVGTKFHPAHLDNDKKLNFNKCVSTGKFKWDGKVLEVDVAYDKYKEATPLVYHAGNWAKIIAEEPKVKVSTFDDYARQLIYGAFGSTWLSLKNIDSKTFNYKVLQLIAEDVNAKYKDCEDIFVITKEDASDDPEIPSVTDVVFNCEDAIKEAIAIIGEKNIDKLF